MKQYKLLITLPKGSTIVWDDKFNVCNGVIEEIKEGCPCGYEEQLEKYSHTIDASEKEDSKQKLVLTNAATLQWANGDTLEWTGTKVLFNGVDINEAIKPKQEIKPSERIRQIRCRKLDWHERLEAGVWVDSIVEYLDEHFSK